MKDYKRLGDYIREVNVRNRELEVTDLLGVSISKEFMPSIANTIGTDMSTYKLVKRGQFAYGPVTSRNGDKVSIALLNGYDDAIISQAYTVFEIIDHDALLPEYLMMWFRRPEFDRYARFHSHGSAREVFDWDELCDVKPPIPSITRQREIVAEYETLTHRIRLNEQMIQHLETTAQALYRKMFVDGIDKENLPEGWKMGTIEELGKVITGKTPSSENPEDFGDEMPFVAPGDFSNYKKFAIGAERMLSSIGIKRLKGKVLPKGSVIVTCIGSDMGKVAIASENCVTNQQMNSIVVSSNEYSDYLFYALSSISKELKAMALGSSTMPLLNKSDFEQIEIIIPPFELLREFSEITSKGNTIVILKLKENKKLTELQSLLLAKMGQ
ncbi:MAG: restriction endonuclease subunit S [Bacteroidaceae bacterium]|nr:restriction endonuclease subunit S [Bacteroidaceae bacterium]